VTKGKPEVGMTVVKAGGPAYRIGYAFQLFEELSEIRLGSVVWPIVTSYKIRLGGGAASSVVGGQNSSELDFSAVQRGDAQMGQKLNRIVRGCKYSSLFLALFFLFSSFFSFSFYNLYLLFLFLVFTKTCRC
jgi:phosphoribosylformylglycinamidine synthase